MQNANISLETLLRHGIVHKFDSSNCGPIDLFWFCLGDKRFACEKGTKEEDVEIWIDINERTLKVSGLVIYIKLRNRPVRKVNYYEPTIKQKQSINYLIDLTKLEVK